MHTPAALDQECMGEDKINAQKQSPYGWEKGTKKYSSFYQTQGQTVHKTQIKYSSLGGKKGRQCNCMMQVWRVSKVCVYVRCLGSPEVSSYMQ